MNLFYELKRLGLKNIVMREIIPVYEKTKPASRIFIPNNLFNKFEAICNKYNIFIEKGIYKIIGKRDIGKGGWSNKIKRKVSIKSKKGQLPYYISRDKNLAKRARNAEFKNNDKDFGNLLGFPSCCQKFYVKYYKKANSKQCDFSLYTLKETKEDYPYNAYNNYVAQYFGFSLLSHFPCSFNCKESAKISKRYYNTLVKYSKRWANSFLYHQKSTIVFTEYRGIFLIKKYKYTCNILYYNNSLIKATLKNKIYNALKRGDNIRIINKNHFIIQKQNRKLRELKGENVGLMIFR